MGSRTRTHLLALLLACLTFAGQAAADSTNVYLFSYFVKNGEDGLHLAWSRDGLRWEALRGGRSFLQPLVGESKLMRDPCLIQAPGRLFHLVWTTSWNGSTIGYASSPDLIQWSAQKAIPVMAHEPAALNCWAPEIFWDSRRKEFLIFWATTVTNRFLETAGQAEGKNNHRIYSTSTQDFKTFTPTRLFFDPGHNVIDATLVESGKDFYLVYKDETVKPPRKHLLLARGSSPSGPFSKVGESFSRDWVEGPTVLRTDSDFIVYFDCYRDHHYGALRTRDWRQWEDVTKSLVIPQGMRHGTALSVTAAVLEPLLKPN
jgi:hypothetical protein